MKKKNKVLEKKIKASNAVNTFLFFDLKKYRKHGYVEQVHKNKALYQLPTRVN